MTALILGILDGVTKLAATLITSQTAAQQQALWDRYIAVTEPLHLLLVKIENLIPVTAPTK
jgi:hypothetical protein